MIKEYSELCVLRVSVVKIDSEKHLGAISESDGKIISRKAAKGAKQTVYCSLVTRMIFTETKLKGAFVIEPEKLEDERGFFARTWCQREFADRGLNPCIVQCSVSFNHKRGTLRGMHYQTAPYEEAKIVRCTRGAIYDVIIDLRPDSTTFSQWLAVELNAENRCMLYVPEGFANGFQTLEDNTEIFYQISEFYAAEYARGVRWDDPAFGIEWPLVERTISTRDRTYPDFIASRGL